MANPAKSHQWPASGIGAWYLDHAVVTNATDNFGERGRWLQWAKDHSVSQVYIAPHAGSDPLIAIPGKEGSAKTEKQFCDFIHLAEKDGIAVQLLASPTEHDLTFVHNCSTRLI